MIITLAALFLAAGNAATPATADADKEKLVCRRETPIGSLIASRKVCMTKSQWEKRAADGNEEARNQVYNNAGRPACNDASVC